MTTRTHHAAERGASLVEYALVLSLFIVGALGVIRSLTDNSEQLLEDSGEGIADHRPFDEDLDDTPVAEAPDGLGSSPESELLTYVEKSVQVVNGSCLSAFGTDVGTGPCGGPADIPVTALSDDGVTLTFEIGASGRCIGVADDGSGPVATPAACGDTGTTWTQESVSGLVVSYRHVETGLCLAARGGTVMLDRCGNAATQQFTVLY